MRELNAHQEIVVSSVSSTMSRSRRLDQSSELRERSFANDELAGISLTLRYDRAGLAPDQLGTASAKATVSAKSQLARRSIELAVTTFHRVDRQAIPDTSAYDRRGLKERLKIGIQSHLRTKTKCARFGTEILTRLVLEVSRHAVLDWQLEWLNVLNLRLGSVPQERKTKEPRSL
jgi:hypothetical protein